MTDELEQKYQRLQEIVRSYTSAIVAFSGGIDSSLVAYVAGQVLGDRALAVTSGSASKAHRFGLVEKLSDDWGIAHQIIVTDELSKADYQANPTNRCFHCKTSLYTKLMEIAAVQGFEHILNGTNLDDMGDHRPGLIAPIITGKVSSCGSRLSQADIRALAKTLGLEMRINRRRMFVQPFPYGTAINQELLAQVEAAETVLADLGFSQCRVRHHGDVARLEIPTEDYVSCPAARSAAARDQSLGLPICRPGSRRLSLGLSERGS